jgi:hypothetical protein
MPAAKVHRAFIFLPLGEQHRKRGSFAGIQTKHGERGQAEAADAGQL